MRKICMLLAAAALAGCGGGSNPAATSGNPSSPGAGGTSSGGAQPPAVIQAMDEGSAVNPAIVTADNAFGLSLFQNLNANATGNVAISPIEALPISAPERPRLSSDCSSTPTVATPELKRNV